MGVYGFERNTTILFLRSGSEALPAAAPIAQPAGYLQVDWCCLEEQDGAAGVTNVKKYMRLMPQESEPFSQGHNNKEHTDTRINFGGLISQRALTYTYSRVIEAGSF